MRLFIADTQTKVRYALRVLLEKEPGIRIAGEADSIDSLKEQLSSARPEILLVDWLLLNDHPEEVIEELRSTESGMKIIILSGRPEQRDEIICAGADAFISKIDPPDRLLAAITATAEKQA